MLPDGVLSTSVVRDNFLGGRSLPVRNEVDYETGGIALNDASAGLLHQVWRARIIEKTEILLDAELVDESVIATGINITEVSLSFDRNMNVVLAYVENGVARLYWYDSVLAAMTTTTFAGVVTPRVALDDKRNSQSAISDVIFAYLKDGDLYYRQQRDRYLVEYLLASDVDSPGLIKIGMNRQLRMQFMFRNPV